MKKLVYSAMCLAICLVLPFLTGQIPEIGSMLLPMHIPVLLSQTGLKELVYNDFHIGDDADVEIIAGCGIHNSRNRSRI